jgi:hypothetical protein
MLCCHRIEVPRRITGLGSEHVPTGSEVRVRHRRRARRERAAVKRAPVGTVRFRRGGRERERRAPSGGRRVGDEHTGRREVDGPQPLRGGGVGSSVDGSDLERVVALEQVLVGDRGDAREEPLRVEGALEGGVRLRGMERERRGGGAGRCGGALVEQRVRRREVAPLTEARADNRRRSDIGPPLLADVLERKPRFRGGRQYLLANLRKSDTWSLIHSHWVRPLRVCRRVSSAPRGVLKSQPFYCGRSREPRG